jgi:hypothetical protein
MLVVAAESKCCRVGLLSVLSRPVDGPESGGTFDGAERGVSAGFSGLHCDECTLFKVSGQACCGLARCAPMPARAFQRILEPGAPSLALLFARRP